MFLTGGYRFESLDRFINDLEHRRTMWREEYEAGQSAMTAANVRFLDTRINRMLKLRQKIIDEMDKVDAEIAKHTEEW
jgi:predicted  nucleic acid-binding Zn-ribbon protein